MSASTWVFLTLAIVSLILVIVGIILLAKRYDTDAEGKKKLSHAKMWSGIILTIFGLVGVIIFTWLFIRGLRSASPKSCVPLTADEVSVTIGTYKSLEPENGTFPDHPIYKYANEKEVEYLEKFVPLNKTKTNKCSLTGGRIFELKLQQ